MQSIEIIQPDDWHVHLRDGDALARTVADTSREFARALVMPNLAPAVMTVDDALAYQSRITAKLPQGCDFQPMMTLYLNDKTSPEMIQAAKAAGIVAVKYYPQGATTNSDSGVTALKKLVPTLQAIASEGMVLCIHGEVTTPEVDIFAREQVFIETELTWLLEQFPSLKLVLEHITTAFATDFVAKAPATLAATITPHHLLLNRNDLLVGGIKPHYYCLPILKAETDRLALIQAAISGSSKFFLGTDSAPHLRASKESACGCAGVYSAPVAMACYAEVFDSAGAIDRLEGFSSFYGADFYKVARNTGTLKLVKKAWTVPETYTMGQDVVLALRAGKTCQWQVASGSAQ